MASVNTDLKVYIKTLGCKVNTYDSKALENQFIKKGYQVVKDPKLASLQVINSCSVTYSAERETRYILRRYKRQNPKSRRVVTGCYAQIDSENLMKLDEVDLVVPNEMKTSLVDIVAGKDWTALNQKFPDNLKPVRNNRQSHFKSTLTLFDRAFSDRTRAFLKIQDGCNGFCSYCQIPYARGTSVSVPKDLILEEVARLVSQGVPEVVITGIHVGDYGRDIYPKGSKDAKYAFVEMLRSIFSIKGLKRLRISSLEPSEVSDEMLKLLHDHKEIFCDHFHLPLQSGSDSVLRRMNRTYTSSEYIDNINAIRSYFPDAHLSADVLVGFPAETQEDFKKTKLIIDQANLNSLHVFPYSSRPNTAAEKFADHVSSLEKKTRVRELLRISEERTKVFATKFLGNKVDVLWENHLDDQGRRKGKTKNYIEVVGSGENKPATITSVRIKGFVDHKTLLVV